MPRNPERKLAPHVQAAIAAGQGAGQAKMGGQGDGRRIAAHVQAAIAAGRGVGQAKMARPVAAVQPAAPPFDVTSFNAQRGNADNERKRRQADLAIERGAVPFLSEMSTTYPVPPGMTMIDSRGRVNPGGGLNYVVPVGSTIHEPTVPADAAAALGGVGRAKTYKGLMGAKGRKPIFLGVTANGVNVYGIHAKSRPGLDAQYALATLVLELVDAGGGGFILVGDLNLPPDDLAARINEVRAGAAAGLHIVKLGKATHAGGKELDYGVTNVAGVTAEQISRANLRGGSDHSGVGFKGL